MWSHSTWAGAEPHSASTPPEQSGDLKESTDAGAEPHSVDGAQSEVVGRNRLRLAPGGVGLIITHLTCMI
jgi:hypothetical protein